MAYTKNEKKLITFLKKKNDFKCDNKHTERDKSRKLNAENIRRR